jgi:tripartite-type tricarboxylate transporter receptor subunit TctC
VVPYAAGGPTDVVGRMVADFLSKDLKQAAFVENKPGAQGAIGAEAVARGDADGYTLLVVSGSMFVLNPMLYKKLPYDPDRDFRTLAIVTEDPLVMEVHPSVPARSIAEFVAYAKLNPGKLSFGSAGTGGVIHLAGEMFKQMAGIEMTHVPYKGAAPALADLLAGNVQVMFDSIGTALPSVRAGSLRALGVSSAQRRVELSDVPTIAESGYPDYLVSVWFAVAVPAKAPDHVADILKRSLDRALDDDGFRATLQKIGYSVMRPQSPAAIADYIEVDRARWLEVVKARNISLD